MKKIVALLLAMLMMLNLSFAMAEDTFEENLAAFLNTLNVENGDLLLNAEAAGQAINVRAGKDEAGVHAALEIAGNAMGEAMLTADTAYVSAMGQGLKVQYQTVQNFAQKIIESMMGSANLSMDQIQADFQMLASKLAGQLFPLMQALKTEEVENGVKYSVDAAVLAEDPTQIAVLPQPFVTVACAQNEAIAPVFALEDEWQTLTDGLGMVTGVTIVRNDFLKEHPAAVSTFISEHQASVNAANSDLDTTAALVVANDIIGKEPIAKKAIPSCNIVCITGDSLKTNLSAYLEVLYNYEPKSVGGKLPGDEFYFKG